MLADTVLKEFKMRLGRIGLEYQTPRATGVGDVAESTPRGRPRSSIPESFFEQVHSFEFWFQSVEGYLAGLELRAPPRASPRRR